MGHDLDAVKPQRFVQSVELGDREIGGLKRHCAEADETVGVTAADLGDEIVDGARGLAPEIGVGAIVGLARRRKIAWMSIPIRSISKIRCSGEEPWRRVRSPFWRLMVRLRSLAAVSRNHCETAAWSSTIAAALSLRTWQ